MQCLQMQVDYVIGYSLYNGHLKYPQKLNNYHCIVFIAMANHFS